MKSTRTDVGCEMAKKVLLGDVADRGPATPSCRADPFLREPRLETDADGAADDLVRLVLALVETVRQLMERQAIRRVESGVLSDEEIERLGLALLRLEERMNELKAHFGMNEEDLSLRLGTLRDLTDGMVEGHAGKASR